MVTVLAGSEESYVRMQVTVNMETLAKAFPKNDADFADWWVGDVFLLQNLVDWDETKWEYKSFENGTYEFWYFETVAEAETDTELAPLFEHIKIPAEMTNSQISELEDFEVKVIAHAIQAETFADAEAAWTAFDAETTENAVDSIDQKVEDKEL